MFGGPMGATAAYIGSAIWSIVLIVLDGIFLAHIVPSLNTGGEHNGVLSALAITLLIMDVLVLLTQGIDLYKFHFRFWPLTALTWFGQFFGAGLASSLLSTGCAFLSDAQQELESHVILATVNLGAHALFTASQFSVTIEYLMRKVA